MTNADPAWFGVVLATADGAVYEVGDTRQQFSIQSISKPFKYGMIIDKLGAEDVRHRIGVEPTGDAFNEISLDPSTSMPLNPMINAGAIAAAGMVVERHGDEAIAELTAEYGRFAGRSLEIDETVFASERATAHRNRAIAHLLRGSGALRVDPNLALDIPQAVLDPGRRPRSRADGRDACQRWRQPGHRRTGRFSVGGCTRADRDGHMRDVRRGR